ncbi:MAG: Gfo/Idh/MocA family oxidoreductase [Chloroflexi bacterium]|nr:Gfo/Idh/MocA family oxidoreductase [Chloroflexota bacterium]
MMLGHVNHFAPAYRVAKSILESGEMGEVVLGTATMQKQWMESNRREWHLDRSVGGGVWLTVGVHPVDRMTWLIGSPVTQVSAQLSTRFYDQQADDTGMAFLRYASGAAGTVVSVGYSDGAPKHLTGAGLHTRDDEHRLCKRREHRPGRRMAHGAGVWRRRGTGCLRRSLASGSGSWTRWTAARPRLSRPISRCTSCRSCSPPKSRARASPRS